MSRSADRCRTTAAALTAAALTIATTPALADAPPQPHTYSLVAHVSDLHATIRDTSGASTTHLAGTTITQTLHADVAFAKDSATLTPAARTALTDLATRLHTAGPGTLTITGYTDNLGTHQHGLELSLVRAQAVRSQLGGLDGQKVTVQGLAEADPVASNDTEAGRAQNRRVEIHFRRS